MSDDPDAEIAQLDLRQTLDYLCPLLVALTVTVAEARDSEHGLAPLTWSVERCSSLLEVCDQLEPLAWRLYDAAAEGLYAQAKERGDPRPHLPRPPKRFR